MTQAEELALMKSKPLQLFKMYLAQLEEGIQLDEGQTAKFEYLKKLFIKDEED
jgi:hypothetical protein